MTYLWSIPFMQSIVRWVRGGSLFVFESYPIREALLDKLGASDASLLMALINYEPSERERRLFLDPIKDLPKYELWIKHVTRRGCKVVLVGKDTERLMDRINRPLRYRHTNKHEDLLTIWLAVADKHPEPITIQDEALSTDTVTHPHMGRKYPSFRFILDRADLDAITEMHTFMSRHQGGLRVPVPDHHRDQQQDGLRRQGCDQQQHREEARHLQDGQGAGQDQAVRPGHDHELPPHAVHLVVPLGLERVR